MMAQEYTALFAALLVVAVHASPCSVEDASTTTTALPADATCNFEGKSSVSGLTPLGGYVGAEDASECWEICSDAYHSDYCIAFTYTPSTKTCVFREVRVGFGVEAADSGTYYWDKACWADYPTCPSETPTPGCLAANATCGSYGTSPNYEDFATFRKVTGGVSQCSDICNGASYASRCKSYIYKTDEIGTFAFYDVPAADILVAEVGGHRTAWDKECLDNPGDCDAEST